MKTIILSLAFLIFGRDILRAADAPLIDQKSQSAFTVEPNERNPFWPIGWKPATKTGPETAGPRFLQRVFLVSSITLGEAERLPSSTAK